MPGYPDNYLVRETGYVGVMQPTFAPDERESSAEQTRGKKYHYTVL